MSELAYPVQLTASGDLLLSSDGDIGLQSVRQIVAVQEGEIPWQPDYGSDFGLFESGGNAGTSPLQTSIKRWLEPDYFVAFDVDFDETQLRSDQITVGAIEGLSIYALGTRSQPTQTRGIR